jgi:hypothetical protein
MRVPALPGALLGALVLSASAVASPPADVPPVPLPTPQLAVDIAPDATLAPNRVVVTVPVTVTCWVLEGATASASLSITQAVGGAIATGWGSVDELPCDGTPHEADVQVVANGGGAPFRSGLAAVQAGVSACQPGRIDDGPGDCAFVSTPPQDLFIHRLIA